MIPTIPIIKSKFHIFKLLYQDSPLAQELQFSIISIQALLVLVGLSDVPERGDINIQVWIHLATKCSLFFYTAMTDANLYATKAIPVLPQSS